VTNATPIIEGQVLVNAEGSSFGALVRGLESDDLKKLTTVSSTLSAGAMEAFDEGDSVIIGARLAERLGLCPE
jgi:lipoprotein-releasing system permease protein